MKSILKIIKRIFKRNPKPLFADLELPELKQDTDMALVFNRCFSTPDGKVVLAYLRHTILERTLVPSSDSASLSYNEGRRSVVSLIFSMIRQGR